MLRFLLAISGSHTMSWFKKKKKDFGSVIPFHAETTLQVASLNDATWKPARQFLTLFFLNFWSDFFENTYFFFSHSVYLTIAFVYQSTHTHTYTTIFTVQLIELGWTFVRWSLARAGARSCQAPESWSDPPSSALGPLLLHLTPL